MSDSGFYPLSGGHSLRPVKKRRGQFFEGVDQK